MNSKVTMVKLSQLMASSSGRSQKQCEDFLRVLFQQIANALESGESVKIKGFGTFKLTYIESRKSVDVTTGAENEIPAHRRIVFVPSKELAAAVNEPFEMFETVILDENVLEEELMQAEATGDEILANSIQEQIIIEEEKASNLEKQVENEHTPEEIHDGESAPVEGIKEGSEAVTEEDVPNVDSEEIKTVKDPESERSDDKPEAEAVKEGASEIPVTETVSEESDEAEVSEEPHTEPRQEEKTGKRWWLYIAVALAALIAGGVALYFVNDDFSGMVSGVFGKKGAIEEAPVQNEDSVSLALIGEDNDMSEDASGVDGMVEDAGEVSAEESNGEKEDVAPTKPSDEPVYDYVSETRYLSTIAKEHYGNYNLWPYIYKENEKILGHPNRIKPGTKVVVPDLEKYGVDPKNKDDIAKAKKMGVEIYSRWK